MEESIYSTVPDECLDADEGADAEAVRAHLSAHPGQFFPASTLARIGGFPEGGSQPTLRKAITEMICIDGNPIIANNKGFCWADNPERLLAYIESMELRVQGIQRRIDAIRRTYDEIMDARRMERGEVRKNEDY